MPTNHQIDITFKPNPPFDYSSSTEHVLHGDTIQWRCMDYAVTDIHFDPPDPAHGQHASAPAGQYTNKLTLTGRHGDHAGDSRKYQVTIHGKTDDPMIVFDDNSLETEASSADLTKLSDSVQTVLSDVIKEMTGTAGTQGTQGRGPQHDPKALFFPGGITNITVSLTGFGVTASVTVSGPNGS